MPTETVSKTACTGAALFNHRFASVVPFLNQRLSHAQTVALDGGASIGACADLRETRDLLRELLRFLACAPLWRQIFAQSNGQALFCRHLSSRQNDLQG